MNAAVTTRDLSSESDSQRREWDQFVEGLPDGTLGQAGAWPRVLRDAYGLDCEAVAISHGQNDFLGTLLLAHFRGLGGGRSLISLPFLDASGIAAVDPASRETLLDYARTRARALNAGLELREFVASEPGAEPDANLPETPRVDLRLELPTESGDEVLWKSLPGKVRNQARKAQREGLITPEAGAEERDTEKDWDDFYSVYAENMRWLGSPPHSRKFFASVRQHFGVRARSIVARDEGRPVAALIALHYAGIVWVPWASALAAERKRCPNHSIYWEALRWTHALGARAFDFGRSPLDSGTHRFKRGWGAKELPLRWSSEDRSGEIIHPTALLDSPALRSTAKVWRRLPRPICDRLGPVLRSRIAS
ncbi:MAG: GNAT family N-acetyltransferase [Myxococcota bacterium]